MDHLKRSRGSAKSFTTHHRQPSTITALQQRLQAGEITAVTLLDHYLERIAEYDKRGPCINAVLELNPDAKASAELLDEERRRRGARGLLHGIPIIVKDNINTQDRLNTSVGSHLLLGVNWQRDADVIARLRRAGAIVIGKSNMDEFAWANGIPSARGGQIRNPYNPARNASGSSGGSAAAVAAEFCVAALGTDTRNSVRWPAADCSLVGIRPTSGRVSCDGVFPARATIDTPGPLASSVTDATIVLRTLCRGLPNLEQSLNWMLAQPRSSSRNAPWRQRLQTLRLGAITRGLVGYDADLDEVVAHAFATVMKAGVTVVDVPPIALVEYGGPDPADRRIIDAFDILALWRYFGRLPSLTPERSLEYFKACMQLSPLAVSIPALKSVLQSNLERCPEVSLEAYAAARARFLRCQRALIRATMQKYGVEILAFPTKSVPATSITHVDSGPPPVYRQQLLASFSGCPEVTVPIGYTLLNLPVGLSLLGLQHQEPRLLECAYSIERAVACWKPARLKPERPVHVCALPPAPVNASFNTATRLVALSGVVQGNTLLASVEANEPRHGLRHSIDRSVWFIWAAPRHVWMRFRLNACRSAFHVLAVYTGDSLGRLIEIGCTNYVGVDLYEVSFRADEGRAYRIVVASGEHIVGRGDFCLRWQPLTSEDVSTSSSSR